jgi:hypothetical protein
MLMTQSDITDKLQRIAMYLTHQATHPPSAAPPARKMLWWSDYDYAAQIIGNAARYSLYFDWCKRRDWETFDVRVRGPQPPRCGGWHVGQVRPR